MGRGTALDGASLTQGRLCVQGPQPHPCAGATPADDGRSPTRMRALSCYRFEDALLRVETGATITAAPLQDALSSGTAKCGLAPSTRIAAPRPSPRRHRRTTGHTGAFRSLGGRGPTWQDDSRVRSRGGGPPGGHAKGAASPQILRKELAGRVPVEARLQREQAHAGAEPVEGVARGHLDLSREGARGARKPFLSRRSRAQRDALRLARRAEAEGGRVAAAVVGSRRRAGCQGRRRGGRRWLREQRRTSRRRPASSR